MADKGDEKYKGHFETPPQSKGGRRDKKPKHQVAAASLKNLRPGWKPGESGNPQGMPKSVLEINRLAREMTPGAYMVLNEIVHNPEAPFRDRIQAAIAIGDRGCGRPAIGVFHGSGSTMSSPMEMEDGTPMNALLLRARGSSDEETLAAYRAEMHRLEDKIERDRQIREGQLSNAADALARGEEISPLTAALLHARAENAKRDAEAAQKAAAAPKRIEAKPDDADSTGTDQLMATSMTRKALATERPSPPSFGSMRSAR